MLFRGGLSEVFLHPDTPEGVALDRGGIGDREAEFLVESDGGLAAVDYDVREAEISDPRFCFVHHAAPEFAPAVFRQNDHAPDHGGRPVDRIDPTGRNGEVVVGQHDILRLRRVLVVKLPPQRDPVLLRHPLDPHVVRPRPLPRLGGSDYLEVHNWFPLIPLAIIPVKDLLKIPSGQNRIRNHCQIS